MNEKKIIIDELIPESALGLIPKEHLIILCSTKRNNRGWVDEEIRKSYIKAATTLAFRKKQMESSKGHSKEFYESEVNKYREFIKSLFASSKAVNA
jgi:hypothetical protein